MIKSIVTEPRPLAGVIAAVPTPVDAQGKPNLDAFARHCVWALNNGCDGLNVLGTTGEANSLDASARMAVMTAAARAVDPARLMVGTGTPDFSTTLRLTRYAAELGYRVALLLPPFYYKPVSDDALYDWFARLDKELGRTPIEVYLYNFPALTGITFSLGLIARFIKDFPQRIRGIKDSSGDLDYCKDIVALGGGFRVFPSSETSLVIARESGFAGCISATVNITAPLAAKAWHGTDEAEQKTIGAQLEQLRGAISAVPLVPAVKHLVGRGRGDSGWDATLPPLLPLNDAQKDAIKELPPGL